jgi:hypothetical protein
VFPTLLLLAIAHPLLAQQNENSLLDETLEQLSTDDEEPNWEEELEELAQRLQQPLNLNIATRSDLEQFPFLSDLQIENILAYVYLHGPMQTIYELQLVAEMDKQTIERLRPFVCAEVVPEKKRFPSLKNLFKYGKQQVLTRLDVPFYRREGYRKKYLGTPFYHSLKYSFRYGNRLQAGLTAEKDAGEPLFALHNRKGYDYYSAHLLLHNVGPFKTVALGDYRVSFGQGLVISNNLRLGKTYSLATADNRGGGINKHSSTDEYNYLRGAAATLQLTHTLLLSAFYSYRKMDGTVKNDTLTSIYKSGLHRSQAEAEKANAFSMQVVGGNLTYEHSSLHVGATALYYFMNIPYEPNLRTYAKYNLHGNRFYNVGIDYRYGWTRMSISGEMAAGTQGYAVINQLQYHLSPEYRLMLIHRYYAHNYWSLFARSFGEGSTPQNENGWYVAAEATPTARWSFFASADLFSFPWWKYRISKPSQGVDVMCRALYKPSSSLSMYVTYRYKRKERDVTGTGGTEIHPLYHHQARYRISYSLPHLELRTTFDYNHFHLQDSAASQGYQCTQLCSYHFAFPLQVSLQGTYFSADDYDARLYVSERGLLYTFSSPSYYGRGFRLSANTRIDLGKHLMLIAKFGETIYQNRSTISSGDELIKSNKKGDLQLQMRLQF